MTTRTEIIAQIDVELSRLQRARDFLTASLAVSRKDKQAASAIASLRKLKIQAPPAPRARRQPRAAAAPAVTAAPPPAATQPNPQPQVKHVPPRRRVERRHLQNDKNKSGAALSGQVPAGPVAVSANEARKVQERAVAAPPPAAPEPRVEANGERSLGSLIQAFERRAALSGLETP